MKWLKWIVIVLVVLVGAGLLIGSFYLGDIIKKAAESAGPKVLGVDVTLNKARVRPLAGKASLSGLHIGNPEGFNSESLFDLSRVDLDMDIKSITSDKILIRSLIIDGPEITYEASLTGSNLKKLIDGLSSDEETDAPDPEEEEEDAAPAKKVVIQDLYIRNAQVKFSMKMLGDLSSPPLPIKLKEIHLKNLGEEKEDASPSQVALTVLTAVRHSVMEGISGAGDKLGDAKDFLQGQAGKVLSGALEGANMVKDQALDAAKSVSGAALESTKQAAEGLNKMKDATLDKATETISGGAGKIVGGLGGLLKKKKDDGENKKPEAQEEN